MTHPPQPQHRTQVRRFWWGAAVLLAPFLFSFVAGAHLPSPRRVTLVLFPDFKKELGQIPGVGLDRGQDLGQRLERRLERIFYQFGEQTAQTQRLHFQILKRPSLSQIAALLESPQSEAVLFLGHSSNGSLLDSKLTLPLWLGPEKQDLTPFLSRLHPKLRFVGLISCANQALLDWLKNHAELKSIWDRPDLGVHGFDPKVSPVDGLARSLQALREHWAKLQFSASGEGLKASLPVRPGIPFLIRHPALVSDAWLTFGGQLVSVLRAGQSGVRHFWVPLSALEARSKDSRFLSFSLRLGSTLDRHQEFDITELSPDGVPPLQVLPMGPKRGTTLRVFAIGEDYRPWVVSAPAQTIRTHTLLRDRALPYLEYAE